MNVGAIVLGVCLVIASILAFWIALPRDGQVRWFLRNDYAQAYYAVSTLGLFSMGLANIVASLVASLSLIGRTNTSIPCDCEVRPSLHPHNRQGHPARRRLAARAEARRLSLPDRQGSDHHMLNADASGRVIHNRYVPHLTAQAAAYDYVHTRARGPYVAPSDANGPVAPADPGRWCVWGHGCSSHAFAPARPDRVRDGVKAQSDTLDLPSQQLS